MAICNTTDVSTSGGGTLIHNPTGNLFSEKLSNGELWHNEFCKAFSDRSFCLSATIFMKICKDLLCYSLGFNFWADIQTYFIFRAIIIHIKINVGIWFQPNLGHVTLKTKGISLNKTNILLFYIRSQIYSKIKIFTFDFFFLLSGLFTRRFYAGRVNIITFKQ